MEAHCKARKGSGLHNNANGTWGDMDGAHQKHGPLQGASHGYRQGQREKDAGWLGIVRHPELVASKLNWQPTQGTRGERCAPHLRSVDILWRDSRANNTAELKTLMLDRRVWRAEIQDSQVGVG